MGWSSPTHKLFRMADLLSWRDSEDSASVCLTELTPSGVGSDSEFSIQESPTAPCSFKISSTSSSSSLGLAFYWTSTTYTLPTACMWVRRHLSPTRVHRTLRACASYLRSLAFKGDGKGPPMPHPNSAEFGIGDFDTALRAPLFGMAKIPGAKMKRMHSAGTGWIFFTLRPTA